MVNKMKNINKDALDEINKGASMGCDAIEFIITKVTDHGLKEELKCEYTQYENIMARIKEIYSNFSSKSPQVTNELNQTMTWYGINMNTLIDSSTSKIADILIRGTTMGIIESVKILNHKKVNMEVKDIIADFVGIQEKAVERLKNYL